MHVTVHTLLYLDKRQTHSNYKCKNSINSNFTAFNYENRSVKICSNTSIIILHIFQQSDNEK